VFPEIGNRNRWFFQGLENLAQIFPSLGKKGGGMFQGLENWRRANLELMQERR
jgi:hypothetical protein